jgi:hypothetical protein
MLIIRNEQMKALHKHSEEVFAAWIMPRLLESLPHIIGRLTHEERLRKVLVAVQRAQRYPFSSTLAIARYVELSLDLGPAFDENADLALGLKHSPDLAIFNFGSAAKPQRS